MFSPGRRRASGDRSTSCFGPAVSARPPSREEAARLQFTLQPGKPGPPEHRPAWRALRQHSSLFPPGPAPLPLGPRGRLPGEEWAGSVGHRSIKFIGHAAGRPAASPDTGESACCRACFRTVRMTHRQWEICPHWTCRRLSQTSTVNSDSMVLTAQGAISGAGREG